MSAGPDGINGQAVRGVIAEITAERERQQRSRGEAFPDYAWWLTALLEEVGAMDQAIRRDGGLTTDQGIAEVRACLVRVAALGVVTVEHLDVEARP